jgi:hypothetical protein
VQQRLAQARADRRSGTNASHPSLLAGMLRDSSRRADERHPCQQGGAAVSLLCLQPADHWRARRTCGGAPSASGRSRRSSRSVLLVCCPMDQDLLQALRSTGLLPSDGMEQRPDSCRRTWAGRPLASAGPGCATRPPADPAGLCHRAAARDCHPFPARACWRCSPARLRRCG